MLYRRAISGGDADITPQAFCNLGNVLHRQGNSSEALRCYTHAIESRHPVATPRALIGQASIYEERRDTTRARAGYEKALASRDPEVVLVARQRLYAIGAGPPPPAPPLVSQPWD